MVNYYGRKWYREIQGTLRVANGAQKHLGSQDSVLPSTGISTWSGLVQKVPP